MPENAWLFGRSPGEMGLREVSVSKRQSRLIVYHAIKAAKHIMPFEDFKHLEMIRQFADGVIDKKALRKSKEVCWRSLQASVSGIQKMHRAAILGCCYHGLNKPSELNMEIVLGVIDRIASIVAAEANGDNVQKYLFRRSAELEKMADVIREVVGNPFRRCGLKGEWLTGDVVGAARGIYECERWGETGVLRDALMDAGCDDEGVLGHCANAWHVKGCWLVDAIMAQKG